MLPPDTQQAWAFLENQPALAGFVLVGGSGLALRIGHRLSEDLDLAWTAQRLPRARLDALRRAAALGGLVFRPQDDESAVHEFGEAGLALHDYQQNFLVNGKVRVSFFAPEAPLIKVLTGPSEARVRVASLNELFKAKCLVSAARSKTRDWIDLYLLLREHGFTLRDYRAAFAEAGIPTQCDIGLGRLCSGVPQKDDEGYAHLLPNPPSVPQMAAYFSEQRDKLEIELAAEARRRRPDSGIC